MRGTKAKNFRKAAAYEAEAHGYVFKQYEQVEVSFGVRANPVTKHLERYPIYQTKLIPNCERSIYKLMKRIF